jgi:hypothetical protein
MAEVSSVHVLLFLVISLSPTYKHCFKGIGRAQLWMVTGKALRFISESMQVSLLLG